MNDEYLWQRTGEDPDIEKLEQKLAVFRHRETPLRIPFVEKVPETSAIPRWRISLAFAFAASIVAAVFIAAVFINIANKGNDETVFVASPELETQAPLPAPTEERKVTPPAAPKIVPQFAQTQPGRIIRSQPVIVRRKKIEAPRPSGIAALTEEEKYAYRQLMLALSISSSKLKIVRDSISGNENTDRTPSTSQR